MKTTSRKAKSVVVVEDQTAICELIIEMLEARGTYRVLGSTADGKEGLTLVGHARLYLANAGITGFAMARLTIFLALLLSGLSAASAQTQRVTPQGRGEDPHQIRARSAEREKMNGVHCSRLSPNFSIL